MTITIVCEHEPRKRNNKIQTFEHQDGTWTAQYQKHVQIYEGRVRHKIRCSTCHFDTVIKDENLQQILDTIAAAGIETVSPRGLSAVAVQLKIEARRTSHA